MWVRFLQRFDFDPPAFGGRVSLAFPEGHEGRVTGDCARAAIASGAAVQIAPPRSQNAKGKDNAPAAE